MFARGKSPSWPPARSCHRGLTVRTRRFTRALESGAADYVVKRFSPTELVARVQAALLAQVRPETFVHGELAVDYRQRRVSVAARKIQLATTELELLRVLSAGAGRIVTTEARLRQVWGLRRHRPRADRRQEAPEEGSAKNAANPTYIFNAHGVGYRIAGPEGGRR